MVTYGTNPGQGVAVTAAYPDGRSRWKTRLSDAACSSALEYMGLQPGQPMEGQHVDIVFIGSWHQ